MIRRVLVSICILIALFPATAIGEGQRETIRASGAVVIEQGEYYGGDFVDGQGEITIVASDVGARVSPLPPHDEVQIDATIETPSGVFVIRVQQPVVSDPAGRFTTWWGVGYHVDHHGDSGIGTDKLPAIESELAAFGLGDVLKDGEVIASGVLVHVMTAHEGLPGALELDVGDPDLSPIPGLPDGHLRVIWDDYEGGVSTAPERARWVGGGIVLAIVVVALLILNRRLVTS